MSTLQKVFVYVGLACAGAGIAIAVILAVVNHYAKSIL